MMNWLKKLWPFNKIRTLKFVAAPLDEEIKDKLEAAEVMSELVGNRVTLTATINWKYNIKVDIFNIGGQEYAYILNDVFLGTQEVKIFHSGQIAISDGAAKVIRRQADKNGIKIKEIAFKC